MFFCQQDSFAKQQESEVVSCVPVTKKVDVNGKKVTVNGCEVVCKDTVLFPEGGGQNSDHGIINDVRVLSVRRAGDTAVHFLETSQDWGPGTAVTQVVDWDRRWDNMQQHSGQHLLSAILENEHNTNTLSWWLAESCASKVGVSYIELDNPVTEATLAAVQERCNEVIRDARPVNVMTYNVGDPELDKAHTRGLPADHTGPVRVVTITGVDTNLCCGTHVSSTSQLQMAHLIGSETKKNKHYVYFLFGGRVSAYLRCCTDREASLTKILNNAPEEHIQLVDKMQKTLKISKRSNSSFQKEVAKYEATAIKDAQPPQKFSFIHRKDGDMDYINTFLTEIGDKDILVIIVTGDGKDSPSQLVINSTDKSKADIVGKAGKRLCELLEGKGGGKGQRFNAKLSNLKNILLAEEYVKSLFSAENL